nr:response regulator [Pyrinomonadaceae bacterium]
MPRPRILIVDDEASVNTALKLILGEQDLHIETARTVAEATNCFGGRPFDLVLTDLRLPDGTGIDLLMRIKED